MDVAVALLLGRGRQDGDAALANHAHQLPAAAGEFVFAQGHGGLSGKMRKRPGSRAARRAPRRRAARRPRRYSTTLDVGVLLDLGSLASGTPACGQLREIGEDLGHRVGQARRGPRSRRREAVEETLAPRGEASTRDSSGASSSGSIGSNSMSGRASAPRSRRTAWRARRHRASPDWLRKGVRPASPRGSSRVAGTGRRQRQPWASMGGRRTRRH